MKSFRASATREPAPGFGLPLLGRTRAARLLGSATQFQRGTTLLYFGDATGTDDAQKAAERWNTGKG